MLVLNHNEASIIGTVVERDETHLIVSTKRLSEKEDKIMACLPYRNPISGYFVGDRVHIFGSLRSYRERGSGTTDSLHLFIEIKHIEMAKEGAEDENLINITGYTNTIPKLRTTPLGKKIADINISCQYKVLTNGRLIQDTIPCIAWNNVAENICSSVKKNEFLKLFGRLEERTYVKDDVTYSVNELSIIAGTQGMPLPNYDRVFEDKTLLPSTDDIE